MNFIERTLFGFVTKAVSKKAVSSVKWFLNKYKKEIDDAEATLLNIDNWIEDKGHKLLGDSFDIPDEYQERYDKAIRLAFDTVEDTMTDDVKWRTLIRAVRAGTVGGLAEAKIKELRDEEWVDIVMKLPQEAKDYVSKFKERTARLKFREIWNIFVGEERKIN